MTELEKETSNYNKSIKKDLWEIDHEKQKFIKDILSGDLGKRMNNIDTYKVTKISKINKLMNKIKIICNV